METYRGEIVDAASVHCERRTRTGGDNGGGARVVGQRSECRLRPTTRLQRSRHRGNHKEVTISKTTTLSIMCYVGRFWILWYITGKRYGWVDFIITFCFIFRMMIPPPLRARDFVHNCAWCRGSVRGSFESLANDDAYQLVACCSFELILLELV